MSTSETMTESEVRKARRAWAQRNSDQLATGMPLPERLLLEEEVPIESLSTPDVTTGVRGQAITYQRHVHVWAVENPDAPDLGTLGFVGGSLPSARADGDGDGHGRLSGTVLDPFATVNGEPDGDGQDGHARRQRRQVIGDD